MKIPKICIPKINIASIREGAGKAAARGAEFVKNAPKKVQTLAQDTLTLAKKSPKETAVIAGAAVAGAAVVVGAANLVKAGAQKIADRKHN